MFISVVVPVRNATPYLRQCCEALLSQDYPRDQFEIIMVDNGSTDSSRSIIERFPGITLLHEAAPGAYTARNKGLEIARGEVVAFTDPDCAPDRSWLRTLAAALADETVHVVTGSYLPARPSDILDALASYENTKNRYIFNSEIPELYYGYTNNMAVRAKLFHELGLFADRLRGSDAIFARTVVARYGCRAVRYVDEMRVAHFEIDSAWSYCRKVFVHAKSVREIGAVAMLRPLNRAERLTVFSSMVRRQGYGITHATKAFLMLASGFGAWTLGTLASRATEPFKGFLRSDGLHASAADRGRSLRALESVRRD